MTRAEGPDEPLATYARSRAAIPVRMRSLA